MLICRIVCHLLGRLEDLRLFEARIRPFYIVSAVGKVLINHTYIKGGEKATLYVPEGNYDVYFYSGTGWNPNKNVGNFTGGFVRGGSMQKDGPVELSIDYHEDHVSTGYVEYTLYPVVNGNLRLEYINVDDVFN